MQIYLPIFDIVLNFVNFTIYFPKIQDCQSIKLAAMV